MQVPFNDLSRIPPELMVRFRQAFERVVSSGWYVQGPEHDSFELELANFLGVEHVVGCGNGTDALQIGLRALGVTAGDVVVTAPNAGGYTATAASLIGAHLVFADVDIETHLLTIKTLEELFHSLQKTPKVVVVTHLYGAAAKVSEIVQWCHARGVLVLEDCAQALGAFDGTLRVGSVGDAATTSFYPTKNLGGIGDGGAIFTNDSEVAKTAKSLRQYGWSSKYNSTIPLGTNSRLDELQAAILRIKLEQLDEVNEKRRAIHTQLEQSAGNSIRFVNRSSSRFIAHLAVIEVEDRDLAISSFQKNFVSTAVHYPIPDHQQQSLGQFINPVKLQNSEYLSKRILSLPLFPELTEIEIELVQSAISRLE